MFRVLPARAGAGLALALCGCAAVGAIPPAARAASPGPSIEAVQRAPSAVRDYWTAARMQSARPADLVGSVPGVLPNRARPAREAGAAKRRSQLHREVQRPSAWPYRTHGRVFFTLGFTDYSCSGTAVRSPSRSLVWTAGHCVSDPGPTGPEFATNWEFVPGYEGGRKPFGEWPADTLATTRQWGGDGLLSGGDTDFDFGAAVVGPHGGRNLQTAVGARRIAFSQARDKVYKAFGYPADSPPPEFDGRHLFLCRSRYRGSDPGAGPPSPLRISCDMTGGSSGGGWVIRRGDRRYVASVTSYGYSGQPNSIYGPYQGGVARRLYEEAGG